MSNVPKNFWVRADRPDGYNPYEWKVSNDDIHLIEYSTYEKLQTQNEKLKQDMNLVVSSAGKDLLEKLVMLQAEVDRLNILFIVSESATGVMHQATKIKELKAGNKNLNKVCDEFEVIVATLNASNEKYRKALEKAVPYITTIESQKTGYDYSFSREVKTLLEAEQAKDEAKS